MPVGPVAFMSYARFNDQHDDGQVSQFRERLAAEVRAQTGEEFAIFQDRNDIAWGQNWQQRIDGVLDAVTLLLVIITPSFFRSPACRAEFCRFLDRERALGRADLILPVYYISAREMDDSGLRESDEMATVLASRQLADWRELRFEPFTSPLVRKSLAQLASRMRDTFWHPPAVLPSHAGRAQVAQSQTELAEQTRGAGRGTAKKEPPTHVVDAYQRGDFATVKEAIEHAKPGDRILVRPGLYEEGLVMDKPLEILGDGPVPDIEIRAHGADALLFQASIGRVANLTLRQAGGGSWFGVDITQGRLDLEGCDISSRSLSGVSIRNGTDPRLRRNKIHHSKESGVLVADNGMGTIEDNDITGNALNGVSTITGGNPTVRRNQIHDNMANGVRSYQSGMGTIEDNDILSNAKAGVSVDGKANLIVRANRINRNGYEAVWIYGDSQAVVEDNDLTGNKRGPWDIAEDCDASVVRARNKE